MTKERTLLVLLESANSEGLARLEQKLAFWGLSAETLRPNWQSAKALGEKDLPRLLEEIDPESLFGRNERATYGIGCELVWGLDLPKIVNDWKDEVIARFDLGEQLTLTEEAWYNLMVVDTDIFKR